MNNLTTTTTQLPALPEDLAKFVLVGREKLQSVRAEIRAIDKLQLAKEVRDQKRDEARMLSEALAAYIEAPRAMDSDARLEKRRQRDGVTCAWHV